MTGARFNVLGVPVRVAPEFVLGLALPFLLNDASVAVPIAVCLAVFVLVHELGHALVARRVADDVSITLSFLVGYAAYRPTPHLRARDRALISVAGPAVEIALGVAVLLAMGVDPFRLTPPVDTPWAFAVWWAGPAIGLLNLVPFHPLDGGHLAELAVDRVAPGRGQRVIQVWTVVGCALLFVLALTNDRWRPWWPTILLFGAWTAAGLYRSARPAPRTDLTRTLDLAARAERDAWETGRPGLFPPPLHASPWYRAHTLLGAGRADQARDVLLASLHGDDGAWVPPAGARPDQLAPLVALLPMSELPTDDLRGALALGHVLQHVGAWAVSARYAAAVHARHRHPSAAVLVARALTHDGHTDDAARWLLAAGPAAARVALTSGDAVLEPLRWHPLVRELYSAPTLDPHP